jgi:hypothetical protein
MAGPQVSNVNSNTQALYKRIGFDDKNKNGVIEKPSIWNRWIKENYLEDADIDKDGKMVAAEAKYYLRKMNTASQETRKEFALTTTDRIALSILFMKKLDGINAYKKEFYKPGDLMNKYYRASAIKDMAVDIAEAELFTEAFNTVRGIEIVEEKIKAIKEIISEAESEAEDDVLDKNTLIEVFNGALNAARGLDPLRGIEFPSDGGKLLYDIVKEMADTGLSKEALAAAAAIEDEFYSSNAIKDISLKMARDKRFHEAFAAARTIADPEKKESAINGILFEMDKAELDKNTLTALFKEAFEASATVEGRFNRSFAISDVLYKIEAAMLDKNSLKGLYEEALKTARAIKDANMRDKTIESISFEMAKAKLFKEALAAEKTIEDPYYKALAIKDIIPQLAMAKRSDEALQLIRPIHDLEEKALAISTVASLMAQSGQDRNEIIKVYMEAVETARKISDRTLIEETILQIVKEMAYAKLISESLGTAATIKDSHIKVKALEDIIENVASIYRWDRKSLYNLYMKILRVALTVKDPNCKKIILFGVASHMIESGFKKDTIIPFITKADLMSLQY